MKLCTKCKTEKPFEDFAVARSRPDGRAGWCKVCKRVADNANYADSPERRKAVRESNVAKRLEAKQHVWKYISGLACVDCGEDDPIVLQFDHQDHLLKTANVADLVAQGYSTSRIQAEIALCDVRCANCHIRRTAEQFGWYAFVAQSVEQLPRK